MSPFNRQKIKQALTPVIQKLIDIEKEPVDLYKNTLDCFSATFDAMTQGITLDDWVKQEASRKRQKSKQNVVGEIHQVILGTLAGVENLKTGKVVDTLCHEKKIVAEIKNKHNTTKGNHKKNIYDDLERMLDIYEGYTGYYVEILPKSTKPYNECFSPSDNNAATDALKKRPINEKIRVIDGASFYEIITGDGEALKTLYALLPQVIYEILDENELLPQAQLTQIKDIEHSDYFHVFFEKAYG
ncbi:MAG: Eco47II family restriction endonuclease [Shewanellaceae bacterium]|nr:Eco47II family restriction endonuclease [Shewanellaceae bacterium]